MSTKTFFKRAALVAIASLGFGLVTVPSSQAAITASSITLGAATATATVGDTATGSWTLRYTYDTSSVVGAPADGGMNPETVIVKFSCEAPSGATCPALQARQTQTADTSNIVSAAGRDGGATPSSAPWINITGNTWGETPTNTGVANSIRSAVSFKAVNFPRAGTYTYTIFGVAGATKATISSLSTTWTVTVSAANTSVASVNSYFAPTNAQASYYRQTPSGVPNASSTDSGIVTSMGTAATPVAAGVLYMVPFNSAGDSLITLGDTRIPVQDTVVVTLTGPGYISTAGAAATGKAISALSISAFGTSQATGSLITGVGYATESVVVWSDGTAGTGTITVTKGSATLLTRTITFTGNPASAGVALSDTYTSIGQTLNLVAQVKDSGGNILTNGTLYVFSSDQESGTELLRWNTTMHPHLQPWCRMRTRTTFHL